MMRHIDQRQRLNSKDSTLRLPPSIALLEVRTSLMVEYEKKKPRLAGLLVHRVCLLLRSGC